MFVCALSILFCACSSEHYDNSLTESELAALLTREISGYEDYARYDSEDIAYMFGTTDSNGDACVLYSRDSDDQGEFGIFKANNSVTAEELFVLVNEYINRSQRERRNFIENYIPSELKKLDNADARIIGDYVIFTILDEDQSREIFSKATELLKVY
jgi:hypothetical protein